MVAIVGVISRHGVTIRDKPLNKLANILATDTSLFKATDNNTDTFIFIQFIMNYIVSEDFSVFLPCLSLAIHYCYFNMFLTYRKKACNLTSFTNITNIITNTETNGWYYTYC